MEPTPPSPTDDNRDVKSRDTDDDDTRVPGQTFTFAPLAGNEDAGNQVAELSTPKFPPEDDIIEGNEIITNTPLLQKAPSLEDGTHQRDDKASNEASNSRSGSTSVRLDEIRIDLLNPTTIHVDWCPVSSSNAHAALGRETVCGYKIRYAAIDNSSYNEIFVTPGISSYTITGLRPGTEYDISVNAVDDRDNVVQTCGWVRQKTDELEDGHGKTHEAPYLTAVAAIALLLVAVVVPVTFLFVRNCGQCTTTKPTEKPALAKDQTKLEEDYLQDSFRHRRDSTHISLRSRERTTRQEVTFGHAPLLLNRLGYEFNSTQSLVTSKSEAKFLPNQDLPFQELLSSK